MTHANIEVGRRPQLANAVLAALILNCVAVTLICAQEAAPSIPTDAVITLNTPRTFPEITSKLAWQKRAQSIRDQAKASCGLVPMPPKTPLRTRIFDRIERDGYSIEKVYFESHPGFFVAGNLYRPLGQGKGPFPAILNPHGHWANGRMTDEKDGSVAARCIHFAKHGMIAFCYDMVGYQDTFFRDQRPTGAPQHYNTHRQFGTNTTDELWNISLMGLQTWNSIRALDFLESLPDADPKRLACTGESGGGTQTFMLGAVDNRLSVQAPIVMVSSIMQGGCSCENAPGLRVRYSNMEIAAAAVPRPQIIVAATGDWTRHTLTVEGPAIERIYKLYKADDRFDYVRYDFGHNYNQTSREAVYGWFNKWLLHGNSTKPIPESPYIKEPDKDLRVFADNQLPANAVTQDQLVAYLKAINRNRLAALAPTSARSLKIYQKELFPAWSHIVQSEPPGQFAIGTGAPDAKRVTQSRTVNIWRKDEPSRRLTIEIAQPETGSSTKAALLAFPNSEMNHTSAGAQENAAQTVSELRKNLLRNGWCVITIDNLGHIPLKAPSAPALSTDFYTTYNRTPAQQGAADLVLACDYLRGTLNPRKLVLAGLGYAGPWAALASPGADAVAADCRNLDTTSDNSLLDPMVFSPGLRAIGGFEGVVMLNASNPLLLHNTGSRFSTENLKTVYGNLGASKRLTLTSHQASAPELLDWFLHLP